MRIPFTKYEIHLTKRGISWLNDGRLVSFADWSNGITFSQSTPIMEEVYQTIATEFAKIDLRHVIKKKGELQYVNDDLSFLIEERPNKLQTSFDFKYVMAYQRAKYGNALAFLERDDKGKVVSINPINVADYLMGNGYVVDENTTLFKFKNKKNGTIDLVDYRDIVHLRENPNNIFNGDLWSGDDDSKVLVKLVDSSLASLISELKENGSVRGVIQIGNTATTLGNKLMADQKNKISKQQEIIDRIKQTKGGILVLDSGEEWKSISSPFESTRTEDIDK